MAVVPSEKARLSRAHRLLGRALQGGRVVVRDRSGRSSCRHGRLRRDHLADRCRRARALARRSQSRRPLPREDRLHSGGSAGHLRRELRQDRARMCTRSGRRALVPGLPVGRAAAHRGARRGARRGGRRRWLPAACAVSTYQPLGRDALRSSRGRGSEVRFSCALRRELRAMHAPPPRVRVPSVPELGRRLIGRRASRDEP